MKFGIFVLLGALSFIPGTVKAQEMVEIGTISKVASNEPTTWSMSGFEMIHLTKSNGGDTPVMRTLKFDARTVEILDRVQSPPLRPQDIKVMKVGKNTCVIVRRYVLAEVTAQDASAEGMSQVALANKWASSVRRVFPQIAPLPSRFGV